MLNGLGLPRVEAYLEVAPDALTAREHRFVANASRRELHDADVLVAVAVAARVCGGLIEGPKAVALPLSPHVPGHLPEGGPQRDSHAEDASAVCANPLDQLTAQPQLHGLQSRPERTK